MLTYYKTQELELCKIDKIVPNCWINAVAPSSDEIKALTDLSIPQDFITYPLDIDAHPRIEEEDDGTILIVVRVPVKFGDKADFPYGTIPLGIVIADKYIITICREKLEILDNFAAGKVKKLSTTKRYRFTLHLMMAVATKFLEYVRGINKDIDQLETTLFDSMRNTELVKIFKYQKSFVYFAQALKQNEIMLVRLNHMNAFTKFEEDEDLLEDVITENTQAIDMTDVSSSILMNTMDAMASVISNNQNIVMKLLASLTIIMEIPNIVTGFLGMNVTWLEPIAKSPVVAPIVLVLLVALTGLTIWYFNKKDWF